MPVHSAIEPVHLATMTCAGIPCEELYESGVDLTPPYAPAEPWSPPKWWGPVWFRDIPQFADMPEDEFEHEVMRYAIDRMRGVT